MKKISYLILSLAILAVTASCDREGPAGPPGPRGPAGADGNANVQGTNTVTVTSWSQSGNSWYSSLLVPAITPDIVDYGSVQVFIQYSAQWWALPDLNGINSTQYGFSDGVVEFYNSNSDGSLPTFPGSKTFRVVVISSAYKKANPDVNWKNYEEVKAVLNLEE